MKSVRLKPGKEKPVRHRHPWIFSGAVDKVERNPQAGEVVRVTDAGGSFLAWGYINPKSQIMIRLLEWQEGIVVDENWWRTRLQEAVARRDGLTADTGNNALRLVYAEADLLPGLIVDKYGDFLVLQSLTAGIEQIKLLLTEQLTELLQSAGIYERSDAAMRRLEGLSSSNGVLQGQDPPEQIEIREHGYRFLVDVKSGQKTGFYLDQKENREMIRNYAEGCDVLDCFAYTGAIGVHAKAGGAKSVLSVDSSETALDLLRQNYSLNGFSVQEDEIVKGDLAGTMRTFRHQERHFDMVILDPPKLAPTKATVPKAQRAYKDFNLLAMRLLRPNGILVTFSCSNAVPVAMFQQVVSWAGVDAGREVQILQHLSQSSDHPVRLSFPESEYLKGLICRVL